MSTSTKASELRLELWHFSCTRLELSTFPRKSELQHRSTSVLGNSWKYPGTISPLWSLKISETADRIGLGRWPQRLQRRPWSLRLGCFFGIGPTWTNSIWNIWNIWNMIPKKWNNSCPILIIFHIILFHWSPMEYDENWATICSFFYFLDLPSRSTTCLPGWLLYSIIKSYKVI